MHRLIPKYARMPLLLCAAAQFLAYYVPRTLPKLPYTINMATKFDHELLVVPAWVLVYVLAYVFWVFGYVAIARVSPAVCQRFFCADLIQKGIAFVCFVLLPTHLPRIEIAGFGAFDALLRLIYAADQPDNLFPSLHCSVSWLVARQIGMLDAFRPAVKIASFAFAVLVFLSTLFTGQHVVADILGGVLVAECSIYLSGKGIKHEAQV